MALSSTVLHGTIYVCLSIAAAFFVMEILPRRPLQLAMVIACLLVIGLVFPLGLIDDSYISLRYARNFADGNGFVFNIGEKVEGYTCFLWIFLVGSSRRPYPR
ncbi:MAG: hypothetical protein V1694_04040 [Candidatus Eisenbacteria bacterium]